MSNDESKPVKKKRLGEILLTRGIITKAQLEQALASQKEEGGYFGEVLVRLGLAKETDIVAALVVQCHVPYISMEMYEIEKSVLDLIPSDLARRERVIPLDRIDDVLSIVMADPLNDNVIKMIEDMTLCKVSAFIATGSEIKKALDRWYI